MHSQAIHLPGPDNDPTTRRFKPVDLKFLMMPLREEFERLFCKTFSRKENVKFLQHLQNCFTQKRWHDLLALMEHSFQGAAKLVEKKELQGENICVWLANASQVESRSVEQSIVSRKLEKTDLQGRKFVMCVAGRRQSSQNPVSMELPSWWRRRKCKVRKFVLCVGLALVMSKSM